MGPIWGRQDPDGTHVGPINVAIWDVYVEDELVSFDLLNLAKYATIKSKIYPESHLFSTAEA